MSLNPPNHHHRPTTASGVFVGVSFTIVIGSGRTEPHIIETLGGQVDEHTRTGQSHLRTMIEAGVINAASGFDCAADLGQMAQEQEQPRRPKAVGQGQPRKVTWGTSVHNFARQLLRQRAAALAPPGKWSKASVATCLKVRATKPQHSPHPMPLTPARSSPLLLQSPPP